LDRTSKKPTDEGKGKGRGERGISMKKLGCSAGKGAGKKTTLGEGKEHVQDAAKERKGRSPDLEERTAPKTGVAVPEAKEPAKDPAKGKSAGRMEERGREQEREDRSLFSQEKSPGIGRRMGAVPSTPASSSFFHRENHCGKNADPSIAKGRADLGGEGVASRGGRLIEFLVQDKRRSKGEHRASMTRLALRRGGNYEVRGPSGERKYHSKQGRRGGAKTC